MILGGGPNRIGQGIEFDYCCCQAAFALREAGYETIMVNSNPETVSTDYDTSDHLFFEPLTAEDVLNICDRMKPKGLIVQFGGQTPLNLAKALEAAGAPIIGTSVDSIDIAEDRERFQELVERARPEAAGQRHRPRSASRRSTPPGAIGFPVLVRPSYVLGGRAMEIVYDEDAHDRATSTQALEVSPGKPILIDKFLESAIEVDVDCLSDGVSTRHRRRHAAHRGGGHPLRRLGLRHPAAQPAADGRRRDQAPDASHGPRAERQGPDERPVRGARAARSTAALTRRRRLRLRPGSQSAGQPHGAVRLQGHRRAAGPATRRWSWSARRSTNSALHDEVVPKHLFGQGERLPVQQVPRRGHHSRPGDAFDRRSDGHRRQLPDGVRQEPDGRQQCVATIGHACSSPSATATSTRSCPMARALAEMGYRAAFDSAAPRRCCEQRAFRCENVPKLQEGRPNLIDHMKNGQIALVINTPSGKGARTDEGKIRAAAVANGVTCITTLAAAQAAVEACKALRKDELTVKPLQDWFGDRGKP